MLNNDDIIGKVKIAILIGIVVVAVMSCGCTEKYIASLPSSDASPSEIVETFASWHGAGNFGACYLLMSKEYTNSTVGSSFEEKIRQCNQGTIIKQYCEFVEVRSEKIEGDSASLEVVYVEKEDHSSGNPIKNLRNKLNNKPKNKTKTINLTKEEEGWRLSDLHCELKGK